MAKKFLQDIVPPEGERSIRKIPLPENRENKINEFANKPQPVKNKNSRGKINMRKLPALIIGIVGILVLSFFIFSSSAEIQIKARTAGHNFSGILTAEKNKESGGIPFKEVTLSKENSVDLEAMGEEDVERKASGEIIVFNNYSQNPQTLIRNTRFETPEGLIYRTKDTITVPGFTTRNKETVPGQLRIRVYADFPGGEYNIGLTDFTIPGFKGLPQFENFFARSNTEMTGGFIGRAKVINEEEEENKREELRRNLESELRTEILTQVPEDFIVLPQSFKFSFNSEKNEESGNMVTIRESGRISGIALDRRSLEQEITSNIFDQSREEVTISNLESLSFNLGSDTSGKDTFEFELSGRVNLVWEIDEQSVKEDLAGKRKREMTSILAQYSGIEEARASIKPFWKRSFPKNPEKIKVDIQ